jgi:hypothetical protein
VPGDALVGADVLGRVQAEAAGEDRQPVPQQPFGRGAQLVAPVDQRAQRALVRPGGPAASGEQREGVFQPVRRLFDGERAQPGGGQFDGERQPVAEPVGDMEADGRGVAYGLGGLGGELADSSGREPR